MPKMSIPGLLPDPLGIVERLTEKLPLPFKIVDPVKHLTGFELVQLTAGLPPPTATFKKTPRSRG